MEDQTPTQEAHPIWDDVNLDIFIKVLNHTALSPAFMCFVPLFYWFQGFRFEAPRVWMSAAYCLFLCVYSFFKWYSRLYRNQGSLLFGPGPLDWGEQIVVVTGGSSGLGELIANTLAVRNVTVVVLDVKPIVTENHNIEFYQCDVSKWEEVEAVQKKIVEEIGHPTILINNAGVVQGKLILDLKSEDVQQTFGVNTIAHFNTLKAFLPSMIEEKRGHVISVGSVLGYVGAAKLADYTASKAALISLHESLRYELDKFYNAPAVRTTLVLPGHMLTPLFAHSSYPTSRLYQFFFPSIAPVDVVKAIIRTMDEQHSQEIYLPFYAGFAPYFRLLPSYLRDFAQWITCADYVMEGFTKLSGRRAEEGPAPAYASAVRWNGHAKED